MNVDFLYANAIGRLFLKGILHSGVTRIAAVFLRSPASRLLIGPYVSLNHIDMFDFREQAFDSFADFFARKRNWTCCQGTAHSLISPCNGLLSIFPIKENASFFVKGSWYSISDLITDNETAAGFSGGLCLIYRLEAADYHHFCYIDGCHHGAGHAIAGTLHSVQPIACTQKPVYRLNRRMWSLMETDHMGFVAQIEVGALLVGDIIHEKKDCRAERGDDMGHFELAGSTIIQLFTKETRLALKLQAKYRPALHGKTEIRVKQGQSIGVLK